MLCSERPCLLQDPYDDDRWKKGGRFWYYSCNNFLKITYPVYCILSVNCGFYFKKWTRRLTYLTLVGHCLFCASLSPIHSTAADLEMPGGAHLGPEVSYPPAFPLSPNQCYDRTDPCGSYYDCKTSFSNNHQETLKKNRGWFLARGSYTAPLGPRDEVLGRQRVCAGPGDPLLLGSRVEYLGFHRFTLHWQI